MILGGVNIFYIPITQQTINAHTDDMFYYLAYCRYTTTAQYIQLTKTEHSHKTFYNEAAKKFIPLKLKISRQTWSKWKETYPTMALEDAPFAPMSFDLYDTLEQELLTLAPKSRNSYAKTFVYLFYNICFHRYNFECAIERMAADLATNKNHIVERVRWFMEKGFIERAGKFKFTGEQTFSYHYFLPQKWKPIVFKIEEELF